MRDDKISVTLDRGVDVPLHANDYVYDAIFNADMDQLQLDGASLLREFDVEEF